LKSIGRRIPAFIRGIIIKAGFNQNFSRLTSIPLYRNALLLIISSLATAAFGFIFWIVVARFYSTTEVGLGSAVISAINIIALLSMAGLNFSLIRFLPKSENPRKLINSSFTFTIIISLVVAGIFIAGINLWSPALHFVPENAIFLLTFIAMAVMSTLSPQINAVFIARRSAQFVLYKDTTLSLLKVALAIALSTFLYTFGVVASWTLALAISLGLSFLLFLPRVERGYKPTPSLDLRHIGGLPGYALVNYITSLFTRLPIMMLPIIVLNLLGTESNAFFYVAWIMTDMLASISRSISQSLFAEGSHSNANIRTDVIRSIKLTAVLLGPAVIILLAAGKWILLAFGPGYSDSSLGLLWLLSIAILPRGIIFVYTGLLRAQDRLKELLIIRSLIAFTVLLLCWLIIPTTGIIGIGYVWLGITGLVSIFVAARLAGRSVYSTVTTGTDLEDVDSL